MGLQTEPEGFKRQVGKLERESNVACKKEGVQPSLLLNDSVPVLYISIFNSVPEPIELVAKYISAMRSLWRIRGVTQSGSVYF